MTAIEGVTGAAHARIYGIGAYRPSRVIPIGIVTTVNATTSCLGRLWSGPASMRGRSTA